MTIKEIKEYYKKEVSTLRDKIYELRSEEGVVLKNKLAELGLDGRVRHKESGHIGELHVDTSDWQCIKFYPLTKKGLVSKRPEYHRGDSNNIEKAYEPYKED